MVEIHLRRLASHKYRLRTGDKSSSQHMMAVHAPTSQTVVAPIWMVRGATDHSKSEHQRAQRVKSGCGPIPDGKCTDTRETKAPRARKEHMTKQKEPTDTWKARWAARVPPLPRNDTPVRAGRGSCGAPLRPLPHQARRDRAWALGPRRARPPRTSPLALTSLAPRSGDWLLRASARETRPSCQLQCSRGIRKCKWGMSARLPQRNRQAQGIWRIDCRLLAALDSRNDWKFGTTTTLRSLEEQRPLGVCPTLPRQSMHARVVTESTRLERWRGRFGCIGVQAVAQLLKVTAAAALSLRMVPRTSGHPWSLRALTNLSAAKWCPCSRLSQKEEASYHRLEDKLVRPGATSELLFYKNTEHFSFVAESQREHEAYCLRPPPALMWDFSPASEVNSTLGFAVVPKKPRPDGGVILR